MTVAEHYDALLAEHYVWMMGDFDTKVSDERQALASKIASGAGRRAVDLGCGPGYQALALADLGYEVLAIDASARLIDELDARRGERAIRAVVGDLRRLGTWVAAPVDVVTCMGDTLTHLASEQDVRDLFAAVAAVLSPGGTFVLSWRDMSQPLEGLDRIIPVRADEHAVMTCFLEYFPGRVRVHDVISLRTAEGFATKKSAYEKLRLAERDIAGWLADAGLSGVTRATGRMTTLSAIRGPA